MNHDDLNQIGELTEQLAVEAMAQLTRFVFRGVLTAPDAAKLAWDIGLAFAVEAAKRSAEAE